ncbi:Leucine aminopeptidase 1 [Chytriomyces hyalinus]|nr:Leucine aminopeptidase 1 [Chytriomyces hyalinus]
MRFLAISVVLRFALAAQIPLQPTPNDDGMRLISTSAHEESVPQWMDSEAVNALLRHRTHFVDTTDGDWAALMDESRLAPPKIYPPPKHLENSDIVEALISRISVPTIQNWIKTFTEFHTRYYKTASGTEAALWIKGQAEAVVNAAPNATNVNVVLTVFEHDWTQPSIIARIQPKHWQESMSADIPIVILSAHLDSVNAKNPKNGRSPGAEDDASGCGTIFAAFQILVEAGFQVKRPIEFHWYSGEEAGLLGSQKVALSYKKSNIQVAGAYNADETGFTPPGLPRKIGISKDFVNPPLQAFVRTLVAEYGGGDFKIVDESCGYACSDHASWTRAGYAAAYLFDTPMKDAPEFVHSELDAFENIDFEHLVRFVRIALGFAVELSLA